MGNYLILNDVNSNTITGLLIQNLPPISKPRQRVNIEEIDGRDGDIITPLGYGAYDKEFQIGLSYNYDVDEIIKYFDSEGKVTFSNEPDKYYNYKIIEQIDFEKLIRFKTATVKMHVQPFKYANNEEAITDEFDPITAEGKSMSLNNTVPNIFNEFSIHGNSEQGSTIGKNKLKINQAAGTINGITYTIKEDGSVIINGTATEDSVWVMENAAQLNSDLIAGQSYILSGCPNSSASTYRLQVYNVEGTQQVKYDIGNGVQFNYVETTSANVAILVKANVTVNNVIIKPMIRLASVTDGTYEPYTGGIASPNPSYPQEIHSTGDNVNLGTLIRGYIATGGTFKTTNDVSFYFEVKKGKTYIYQSNGNRTIGAIYNDIPTNNQQCIEGTFIGALSKNTPFTAAEDGIMVIYTNAGYSQDVVDTFKVEKGTVATPYTPYGVGSVNEKVQNKNLIESTTIQILTPIAHFNNYSGDITVAVKLTGGTSQFNYKLFFEDGTQQDFAIATRNSENKWYCSNRSVQNLNALSLYNVDNSNPRTVEKVFIAKGTYQITSDDDYIDHEEQNISIPTQQPMRAIGEYKDTFVKVDGAWYERHYIGQKIFDGSENNWSVQTSGNIKRFVINIPTILGNSPLLCNYFIGKAGTGELFINGYVNNPSSGNISFCNTDITTIADWKTWLSNNNVEVIYILATPVDLPCTEEQTQVLESKKHSYDGQTHISSLDATPAHMKVAVNGDTSLTVRNEGNIYSKPVFTISGSGDISMYLNNSQVFEISLGDEEYITIDIDKMEAYKGEVLKNRLVKGNYENCVLETGDNTISFTGAVTGIEISNYSRWI